LLLPRSLKSAGPSFLAGCSIKKLDLSQTGLETVGNRSLSKLQADEVLMSPILRNLGTSFLAEATVKSLDLSKASVKIVGAYAFLDKASIDELLLPAASQRSWSAAPPRPGVKRVTLVDAVGKAGPTRKRSRRQDD
jgi:hypothetical protein